MNPVFTIAFIGLGLALLVWEIIGVRRKKHGDTITEHWHALDQWLKREHPVARWFYRIFTAGLLVWALLHFISGAD